MTATSCVSFPPMVFVERIQSPSFWEHLVPCSPQLSAFTSRETVFRAVEFYATLILRLESMPATSKSLRVGRLNFAQAEFRAATHQPFGPPLTATTRRTKRALFRVASMSPGYPPPFRVSFDKHPMPSEPEQGTHVYKSNLPGQGIEFNPIK